MPIVECDFPDFYMWVEKNNKDIFFQEKTNNNTIYFELKVGTKKSNPLPIDKIKEGLNKLFKSPTNSYCILTYFDMDKKLPHYKQNGLGLGKIQEHKKFIEDYKSNLIQQGYILVKESEKRGITFSVYGQQYYGIVHLSMWQIGQFLFNKK